MNKNVHPALSMLRQLRKAAGLSLAEVEKIHGLNRIVVGSYERGDRQPTLNKIEEILGVYGYTLSVQKRDADAIRLPEEIVSELRQIANQLEKTRAVSPVS